MSACNPIQSVYICMYGLYAQYARKQSREISTNPNTSTVESRLCASAPKEMRTTVPSQERGAVAASLINARKTTTAIANEEQQQQHGLQKLK